MELTYFLLFVFWASFCFAKLEIAIEGKNGWADQLPTWRLPREHVLSRLLAGGRELTGYHFWVHVYNVSVLHMVYLFLPWNPGIELRIFSFLFALWIVEDFLWFVLNPEFGIKKFKKENIWWHERDWWGFAPKDYFVFLPISAILYWISATAL